MTVETTVNRIDYVGSGVGPYSFPYEVFETTDLEIKSIVTATGIETLLVLNVDYTVVIASGYGSAAITLTSSLASTSTLVIKRILPFKQLLDLLTNGDVPSASLARQFDKIVMLLQQVKEDLDRAATFSDLQSTAVEFPQLDTGVLSSDGSTMTWTPITVTETEYAGTISFGLDANKSATPVAGDIYVSLDTGEYHVSFSNNNWTNVRLSINDMTEKATLVDADLFVIEDSADSNTQKKVQVSTIVTKAIENNGAKDAILRGLELVYSSTTVVIVNAGTLFHNNTQIDKTANISLNVGTAGDWFDGSAETYAGAAGWCYIGVDSSGNVKLLGSNPPDVADTSGNTDGPLLYFDDSDGDSEEYWRVIGAVRINTSDNIIHKWYQVGEWVIYDEVSDNTAFRVLNDGAETSFADVDCTAQIPSFGELCNLMFFSNTAAVLLSARRNGSAASKGKQIKTSSNAFYTELNQVLLDTGQIFEYMVDAQTVDVFISGYYLGNIR